MNSIEKLSLFNDQRIEDFGEVIEGAAKFIRMYTKKSIDELNPEDCADIKKQMIWDPNWKNAQATLDPIDYAVQKAIYQRIHNPRNINPSNSFDVQSVKAFIYFVDSIKAVVEKFGYYEYVSNGFLTMAISSVYRDTSEKFDCPLDQYSWYTRQSYFEKNNIVTKVMKVLESDFDEDVFKDSLYNIYHIVKNDGRIQVNKLSESICSLHYAKYVYDGYICECEDIKFDDVKYFVINDMLNTAKVAYTKDEAVAIVENSITRNYQSIYLTNGNALFEETKQPRIAYIPITLEKIERIGPQYHKDNIDTQQFMDTFNVRGGQFGNSVTQVERQNTLNHAYDAMKDLADVLGIDNQSISFNGKLAIAFGARGKKNALAHYEPNLRVINLTRMKGCGTLSHEWMHALDHEIGLSLANINGLSSDNRVVKEVDDIMDLLMFQDAAKLHPTQYYEDSKKAARRFMGYWDTRCEMLARAFACYVSDRLADMGRQNDYLNYTAYDPSIPSMACFNAEGKKMIYGAIDNLINMLKEKEILKRKS